MRKRAPENWIRQFCIVVATSSLSCSATMPPCAIWLSRRKESHLQKTFSWPSISGRRPTTAGLKQARELYAAAADLAAKAGSQERAAQWKTWEALAEAEIGNTERAGRIAAEAVARQYWTRRERGNSTGLCPLLVTFRRRRRLPTSLHRNIPWTPRSNIVSFHRSGPQLRWDMNQPNEAIDILAASNPYDLGDAFLIPAYLRGLAYLKGGNGRQAAGEFQKLLDHPGILESDIKGALAHLQLGRAQAMMGDKAAARKSYQDFLTLWKDADPDIPIYQQAKAEYSRL